MCVAKAQQEYTQFLQIVVITQNKTIGGYDFGGFLWNPVLGE